MYGLLHVYITTCSDSFRNGTYSTILLSTYEKHVISFKYICTCNTNTHVLFRFIQNDVDLEIWIIVTQMIMHTYGKKTFDLHVLLFLIYNNKPY